MRGCLALFTSSSRTLDLLWLYIRVLVGSVVRVLVGSVDAGAKPPFSFFHSSSSTLVSFFFRLARPPFVRLDQWRFGWTEEYVPTIRRWKARPVSQSTHRPEFPSVCVP